MGRDVVSEYKDAILDAAWEANVNYISVSVENNKQVLNIIPLKTDLENRIRVFKETLDSSIGIRDVFDVSVISYTDFKKSGKPVLRGGEWVFNVR